MTYISYVLTFDDSDMITLEQALSHYLSVCEREIAKGGTVPFIAHKVTIEQIRSKLNVAMLDALRDRERWARSVQKIVARPKTPAPTGRTKRAFHSTLHTKKSGGKKRKPK